MHVFATQLAHGKPHHPASWGVHTDGLHVRAGVFADCPPSGFTSGFSSGFRNNGEFDSAFSSAFLTYCPPEGGTGTVSAVAELSASINQTHRLAGTVEAVSQIKTTQKLEADAISAVAEVSGDLRTFVSAAGSSVVFAFLDNGETVRLQNADVEAVAELSAVLTKSYDIDSVISGDAFVTATLDPLLTAVGRGSFLYAYLDTGFAELRSTINGEATTTASLFYAGTFPYKPLNYPLGGGDGSLVELSTSITGDAEMFPTLTHETSFEAIEGTSTVTATLGAEFPEESIIYGDSTVVAELFVTGDAELAATINGTSFFYVLGDLGFTFLDNPFAYYIYLNVGVGFDPTDTSALADSQTFTDGNITTDFSRNLYQYVNVGVGFDDTDDASGNPGFVSQTYPDGNIVTDFSRNLYQYLNVIDPTEDPFCRLTIGPAPRSHADLTPTPRPPRRPAR